jgi:MFS family permease
MIYVTPLLLILSTLLIQLASGINYVTMPVVLSEQGNSNMMIGIAMACEILAMLFFYSYLGGMVKRLGVRGALVVLSLLRGISVVLLANNEYYVLWLLGIFCYGAGTAMMLVLVQTWLNIVTEGRMKGVMMGLFSSALSCGVAMGPLLLQFIDFTMPQRFYFNGAVSLVPLVLLISLGASKNLFDSGGRVRVGFVFRHAKTIFISAIIGGIGFYGLPNFLTLYGIENGLTEKQAPLLMTTFMLGSVFLGMAFSSLSGFFNRQIIVLLCIFCSVVCGVFLSLAVYSNYIVSLGLLFVWGGCMGGIYAIGLTSIGDRFSRSEQISANTTFTLMDSLGGILGLVIIGLIMDAVGPEGMTYVFIASGCCFLVFYVRQIISGDNGFNSN